MNEKRLLILGGYGNTGRLLAKYLLIHTEAALILAGRDASKALNLAAIFNDRFPGERVEGRYCDAAEPDVLAEALAGVDMIVVASSTADYTVYVAEAALQGGVDYFDVQYAGHKFATLKGMERRITEAGRCFITDGGFHPGLPAALIRYLAPEFDRLDRAIVGSVIRIDWASLELSASTMEEFAAEFGDFQTLVFRDGRWQKAGFVEMMKPIRMDFGPPFGHQYCVPMFLEEMRAIPELVPTIEETGFFVGSLNWFVDWFISPLVMAAMKLWPQRARRPMGRLMFWGLRAFSRPPCGTRLKVEARGVKDGIEKRIDLVLSHEDGYAFTAIPAAACLLQYLDGSIRRQGLWLQANVVDAVRMMADMSRLGVEIRRSEGD